MKTFGCLALEKKKMKGDDEIEWLFLCTNNKAHLISCCLDTGVTDLLESEA